MLDHKEKDLHEIKLDLVCGHYAVVYLTQEKFYVVQNDCSGKKMEDKKIVLFHLSWQPESGDCPDPFPSTLPL